MDEEIWYLHKVSVNEIYGPTSLSSLSSWAAASKINPMDRVSRDGRQTWLRAPMIPELQMDWLLELDDGALYGPTNLGTIQDFLQNGEITPDNAVINCLENTRHMISELTTLHATSRRSVNQIAELRNAGAAETMEIRLRLLEDRMARLEQRLQEME